MLALGRSIGGKFNLIPYGGGSPTSVAVLNGEADIGALPIAGVIEQKETLKVVGIFNDDHKMARVSENAPSVNKIAGSKIPDLPSSRSWAVHTDFIEKSPERFAILEKTAKAGLRRSQVRRGLRQDRRTDRDQPVRRPRAVHPVQQRR